MGTKTLIGWEAKLAREGMPAELPLLLENPSMFVPFDKLLQVADAPTNDPAIPSATEVPDRWEFLRWGLRTLSLPVRVGNFVESLLETGSKQGMKGQYPGYWRVAKENGFDWRQAVKILRTIEMRYLLCIGAGASDACVRTAKGG